MYDDIVSFYDEIFPLNQAFLAFIPAYLGGTGARILDLGCGPGDYVDSFSQMGYQAFGIDPSTEMIRAAQRSKQGVFFNLGFGDLGIVKGPFDCIFSIGNSLSYHHTDQMTAFYQDLYNLLNPGGYAVLQVVNWDQYRQVGLSDFGVKTLSDGHTFHRCYQPGTGSTVVFHTELRLAGEPVKAWSASLYPKYSDDLRQGIEGVGMAVLGVFGDYQQSPYTQLTSPATILVIQKEPGEQGSPSV